ncbi:HD domain-containing phosphohydrolase [Sulfurospirillum barnesii]|uniref:HD-GYP domain-containing protein n=1 Tax=Sulfurospirillum barnesii (strain ATCC 700032 / DSM 10660 / SES-3) TaxID=760154 RepID=I3Y0T9_SULBS|nr:HD domain-containing phosphohydrolase [Sulfurospirillum barnesii]AFL69813.1 HD-GYP domain-containing protein [Sulfurospirillum barnesii SES-3]
MSSIRILGSQGSRSKEAFTTCIYVNQHTLIDAGNIIHALGEEALHVNRIFFSHAHLDHIIDTAFVIDHFFSKRTETLYLYGLPHTLEALKKHLFNDVLWPDFSQLYLPNTHIPAITYVEIDLQQSYAIEEGITLTPILANHSVPCCGYFIEQEGSGVLFSGDTFRNEALWKRLNEMPHIKALIIDVSFPNHFVNIATTSKHLTPAFLKEEMSHLKRTELKVYVNHLKSLYTEQITQELAAIGIGETMILKDAQRIDLASGALQQALHTSKNDKRVQKLTEIGTALSANESLDVLLEMIVTEAKNLTNADGGTLYLLDNHALHFKVIQTDSLHIKMGGTSDAISWLPLPLYLEDSTPNKTMVAATCALEDRLINIPDVYEAVGFSFEGTKQFDKGTGYRSKSMLVIPMKNHEKEIIGVLQLINKYDYNTHNVIPFDCEDEKITLSLASQAAIAITNTSLIQGLETLLESFLKSIIFAISKKSPYSAGHIQRMVRLSVMFAEAINEDQTVYANKHFSAEEIKQINFAALMHDIGKLATPEQIIDKACKLETLFDRIGLIETRFALIQKALHIAYLEGKLSLEEKSIKESLLESYWHLIQRSNTGVEFTNDEDRASIQSMAQEPWNIDGMTYILLTQDEAYNLSVQRGTLTKEERDIINAHAKLSVDILNRLPFPKKYQRIPEISGNHHEKLNGKGYPQGLQGDEISFEARILAIADIFEALTAHDRPYKEGMPLSKAMKILYTMAKEGEIDEDLVRFFYTSGLYLNYAKHFLPKHCMDEVSLDF